MKVSPKEQAHLLHLQDLDTRLAQLAHRREGLPELLALRENAEMTTQLLDRLTATQLSRAELAAEQQRLEGEVATLQGRLSTDRSRLASGAVTTAREFDNVRNGMARTAQLVSDLEEQTLEVMLQADEEEALLAELEGKRQALAAEEDGLRKGLSASAEILDGEEADLQSLRLAATNTLTPALLQRYERTRSTRGGLGAARLVGATCSGCNLSLPATDRAAILKLPEDSLASCPECGRLLVR